MAEQPMQDRTEEATPKRLEDARNEGNIAKSIEVGNVALLLCGAGLIALFGSYAGNLFAQAYVRSIEFMQLRTYSVPVMTEVLGYYLLTTLKLLAPFLLTLALVAIAIGLVQTQGLFTLKALEPKWNRLNPLEGVKKFFGVQPIANLVKQVLKLVVIGVAAYVVFSAELEEILFLIGADPARVAEVMSRLSFRLLFTASLVYLALAAADFYYARWEHSRKLRMTKQEIKEESKSMEGDPQIKSRIRSIQLSMARKRMMQAVPEADVVIKNPTHRAIALKYDPTNHAAPLVLAMGERKTAERIIAIAEAHGIPTFEDRVLAKTLLKTAKVGKPIPVDLYVAVAEVLAYVYRQRNQGYSP